MFRGFDALRACDEVKAWLLTIVNNCHFTTHTQQRRGAFESLREEHALQDDETMIALTPDPKRAAIQQDEKGTLDRLMLALPEAHREVLLLREIEEINYREIATVTNVPIGTVMSRLARARAALKARWLQEVYGAPHAMR